MYIVLDVENTTTKLNDKHTDFMPYNPSNKLVSVGYYVPGGNVQYFFLHHNEISKKYTDQDNAEYYSAIDCFKSVLKEAKVAIAHNAKYDMSWLAEAGFDISHLDIQDTMIREYVMARGRTDLSFKLGDLCSKYQVAAKKKELVEEYYKKGIQMDAIPIEIVEEYGRADIVSCWELFQAQEKRLNQPSYIGLKPTVEMMNEFCKVLIYMERNGISIDEKALNEVAEEFQNEADDLRRELTLTIHKVMGDTPINLDSPAQLSEVVYSRSIKEGKEEEWVRTFNIGTDDRGKHLRRPKMSYKQYGQKVQELTKVVLKTEVERCTDCTGKGYTEKFKLDGTPYKRNPKCKTCTGAGIIFKEINDIAGFKMKPASVAFTTVNGFSTGKTFLDELLDQAKEAGKTDAYEFITKIMRLSAISSYLSSFIGGIKSFKHADVLHPNFNQCITATGRLSSTKPNLQNQPRESTFPIRRVFKSRFEGGKVVEVDFAQLEFRAAVHLAGDNKGKEDILNGIDIHIQTRDVITSAGQPIDRQEAKSHTFKPLYGGKTGTEAERTYYKTFLNGLYRGIGDWHHKLQEEAIATKIITIPTGRQYIFPDVERGWHGGCTKYTQVVNYPVQGFATADIVPCAIIRLHQEFLQSGLQSKLVLTVHDSIVADVHPSEYDKVLELMRKVGQFAEEELTRRYEIDMFVPLTCEVKAGYNLMETKKVA